MVLGTGTAAVRLLLAMVTIGIIAASCRSGGRLETVTGTPNTGTATPTAAPDTTPSPSPTLFGTYTPTSTPTPSPQQFQVYRNDAYGYSFSIACPPFCQIPDTALDAFNAPATDGSGAWLEARVYNLEDVGGEPTLAAFHELWSREMSAVATDFQEGEATGTTLVDRTTPALMVVWTATSAADGSALVSRTLLTVSGPVGYALSAGAPEGRDRAIRDELDLVFKTYNVEGQSQNVPGVYRLRGFTFRYPPGWETEELGQTRPRPDEEEGGFRAGVRPPGVAVVILLTWNTVPAESFEPARDIDTAMTQAQQSSGAYRTLAEGEATADGNEVAYFLYQDALDDGRPIFAGFGEWFCPDSSRVFTLFWATDDMALEGDVEAVRTSFEGFTEGFSCTAS